ncbi:elongation factor P [bacterium]|nr:MAG: elongation factor P [bacterium]
MNISELNIGTIFMRDENPFEVLFREHSKTGRGGAVLRTKIKNLKTGAISEETFKAGDKFEEANMIFQKMQFLYKDGEVFYFMDNDTFEQVPLSMDQIGEQGKYLTDGIEIEVILIDGNPLGIKIPIKMDFEVVESPPAVKGNTVDGGSKKVVLSNGIEINTPLFIKQGDVIKINTQTGEYVERK